MRISAETEFACRPSSLSVGSIFIRNDAPLPYWFRFNSQECDGWKQLFDTNSYALERTATAAGWHFSYIASAIAGSAWGRTGEAALYRAAKKIMETAKKSAFNSFEITGIAAHELQVLHWVRVTAHPRHFSCSPFLTTPDPLYYPHAVEQVEDIIWHAAQAQPQVKGI